jgi:hypothetical protein
MASNGHFLVQIPQPMQSGSERKAIFDVGVTSIQSRPVVTKNCQHAGVITHGMPFCDLPIRTTGQLFLHSCLHFLGLHFSAETKAEDRMVSERACNRVLFVSSPTNGNTSLLRRRRSSRGSHGDSPVQMAALTIDLLSRKVEKKRNKKLLGPNYSKPSRAALNFGFPSKPI